MLLACLLPMSLALKKAYQEFRQPELNRALIAAIQQDDTRKVISLLSEGADANACKAPVDSRPIWRRFWDRLRGKPLPAGGMPITLWLAVQAGSAHYPPRDTAPMVRALLDAGAVTNVTDDEGRTPLMWAIMLKKQETSRILLEKEPRVNLADIRGETLLHYAAQSYNFSLVQRLLARGADVNARTKFDGITPLHYAAFRGHIGIVRLILAKGGEVNARDYAGNTPLSDAVRGDRANCVRLLLASGASVNTKDNEGNTPLFLAQGDDNVEIMRMLKKAGAKNEYSADTVKQRK